MGLNPLVRDSDGNGTIDSEEVISQTYYYDEDEPSIIKSLEINSDTKGSIYNAISVDETLSDNSVIYDIENENFCELRIKLFLQESTNTDTLTINLIGAETTELQFLNNGDGNIELVEPLSAEYIELEINSNNYINTMSSPLRLTMKTISSSKKKKLKSDIKNCIINMYHIRN